MEHAELEAKPKAGPTEAAEVLRALHNVPHSMRLSHAIAGPIVVGLMIAVLVAWNAHWWLLVVVLWGAIAWLDHSALTRLHECAHGTMTRTRWLNETFGVLIGTFALTPLSVYRYIHHKHHAYLGDVRDPEFWPYSDRNVSRGVRLLYAWTEVFFGWIFTPATYSIRTAKMWATIVPHQRRRLVMEWAIMAAVWGGILTTVAMNGWWVQLAVMHIIPAWLAGMIQTTRKFTEHMGLFGPGILALTRTVRHEGLVMRAASRTQLHVDHHGTHHRWARIPYYHLPEATEIAFAAPDAPRLYKNYLAAILDTLPHLLDPKIGPEWLEQGTPERHLHPVTVDQKPEALVSATTT